MESWYNITKADVAKHGGSGVVFKYYGSVSKALKSIYPEHDWDLQQFKNKPSTLWKFNGSNRRLFFKHLSKNYQQAPHGFWDVKQNHKVYCDWPGEQLGNTSMDDWYKITREDISKYGGSTILHEFSASPSKVLQSAYPEHEWMLWRFTKTPFGYWEKVMRDSSEQKKIVNWLGAQLSVSCLEDWYRISVAQPKQLISIKTGDQMIQLLQGAYPEHRWDFQKLAFRGAAKSSQRSLALAVKQLFPGYRINIVSYVLRFSEVSEDHKHSE